MTSKPPISSCTLAGTKRMASGEKPPPRARHRRRMAEHNLDVLEQRIERRKHATAQEFVEIRDQVAVVRESYVSEQARLDAIAAQCAEGERRWEVAAAAE